MVHGLSRQRLDSLRLAAAIIRWFSPPPLIPSRISSAKITRALGSLAFWSALMDSSQRAIYRDPADRPFGCLLRARRGNQSPGRQKPPLQTGYYFDHKKPFAAFVPWFF